MTFIFDQILRWASEAWLPLVLIVLVATIAEYVGKSAIRTTIRRTFHGRHFGRIEAPSIDVKKRQDTIIGLTLVLWKIAIFLGTGLALLSVIFPGINLAPLFASAGVMGAVIGFGAQSIIKDFIAGISIITENQFRVGDMIEVEGGGVTSSGTVEHITLRGTVLRDDSGNVHYIANGAVLHVTNKTMGYSKVNFMLAIAPDSDVDKIVDIINKVGKKIANSDAWKTKIIEPPTFTNIGEFNDKILELKVSGKTVAGEQWGVTNELKKRLQKELSKNPDVKAPKVSALNLSLLSHKKK